jgi:uncharacterized protein (DUF2336 family)
MMKLPLWPKRRKLSPTLSYEEARSVLAGKDHAARQELAAHPDARPEMLYYLAGDESASVRRCVATNPNTPLPADRLLANDNDDEVRCELARKIGALMPGLDETEQVKLREQTIEVMELLASDQLPRVRQIIAEEVKSADNIPHHVVLKLARDIELAVCGPILQYSPLLNKDDLIEIIASTKVQGALTAIARRSKLDADVSDRIAATLDVPAVAALLVNTSAQIREETLDAIIEQAVNIKQWHAPIVMRPNLSIRALRRISTFVATALIDQMINAHALPAELVEELREKVVERIRGDEFVEGDDDEIRRQAERIFERGEVTGSYILQMLEKKRFTLVMELLALAASLPRETVRKIVEFGRPEAVTALAWKAGLTMRTALGLQEKLALIPPNRRLNARNGLDFPLTEDEMRWQIDFYAGQGVE